MKFKHLLLCFALIKVGYFLFAFLLAHLEIPFYEAGIYKNISNAKFNDIVSIFGRWDYGWYRFIATSGYEKISFDTFFQNDNTGWKQCNWGFMPGYPLLLKILYLFFQQETGAFILNLLISIPLAYFLYHEALNYFNQNHEKAFYVSLLFLLTPFNFYLSCFLTEPLFLLLVLWGIYALQHKQHLLLATLMGFMVIVRPTGLFVIPLFYLLITIQFKDGKILFNKPTHIQHLIFLIPILTFAIYSFYAYSITGDWMAYTTAQKKGWNKHFTWPFKALFINKNDPLHLAESIYTIVVWLISCLALYFKRINLFYFLFIIVCSTLSLIGGSTVSAIRYISIAFPFFFFLYDFLVKKPITKWVSILVFTFAHYISFYLWLIADKLSV